jgi:flagellar protein FliL
MAEPTTADATEAQAGSERKKSKLIPMIAVAALVAAGTGGGVYWFTTKSSDDVAAEEEDTKGGKAKTKAKEEKPKGPAIYVEFDPPFVVNFEAKGMTRFLQVTIQVMTRDPTTAELVKQHDPVIRNDLLLLFSNQTYDTISTREGKEKLRAEALQVVATALDAEGASGKSVEQLYFTSFVMQ